ncbi:MAG: histidine kinase, partial [Cytophagales bacterium]|nr:histidine kinase [Cytophagales bacterium]
TYLEQLADVYRYLLENREKHLISLNEELTFASAYISLNKTRFRDDLSYKVELDTAMGGALLPPYALQLTLENAIKHNAIGRDKTLQVEVTNEADYLVVSNNKRPKPVLATSTGMGLENLRHRSLLATGKPIEVIDRNDRFTVKIPVVFQDDQFSNTPGSTNVNTSQHAYSNY